MSDERDTDSCALCGGRGHTRSNCPWGGKLVTLLDGTEVSTAHPAWRPRSDVGDQQAGRVLTR